ncbi:hypothetical protein [Kitasatospora indigofera]
MTNDDLVLTVRPDLTDEALGELFTAAWPELEPFYARCGFRPTAAGLPRL